MSTNELKRAGVLARVAAGTLCLGSAAALMAVSYRQAKRLYRRYRREGAAGLKHRSAGRASNQATDVKIRERARSRWFGRNTAVGWRSALGRRWRRSIWPVKTG